MGHYDEQYERMYEQQAEAERQREVNETSLSEFRRSLNRGVGVGYNPIMDTIHGVPREEIENTRGSKSDRFTAPQGAPIPNGYPSINDLVVADLRARKASGLRKYGTTLQGMNGRDALIDAYQEALDLTQYLRQELFERYGE